MRDTTPTATHPDLTGTDLRPRARTWIEWAGTLLGGWPGPAAAAGDADDRERLRAEKVRSGPEGIILPWMEPYLDPHTAEPAAARAAYRRMMADPDVKGSVLQVLFNVASLDLKVTPPDRGRKRQDREAADFVNYCLTESVEGGWPGAAWNILSGGMIDGYSLNEKVYGPERSGRWAGHWTLHALRPKDVNNDVVLTTDRFKRVVHVQGMRYNAGKNFAPGLFLYYRHLPLYDNPTGMSALRAAYGAWWRIDTAKKLRAIALEKNAAGFLVGTYDNPSVKPTLDDMLARVKSRNWASVPLGTKIEVLSLAGQADAIFAAAIKDERHEIAKAICGASLQSVEGVTEDGRGDSRLHGKIADRWSWFISASLMACLNDRRCGLVREMVDLNFVVSEHPRVSLSGVDALEMARELDVDERLHNMGLPLSRQELYEHYGRRVPDREGGDELVMQAPPPVPGGADGEAMGGPGGVVVPGPGEALAFAEARRRAAQPGRKRVLRQPAAQPQRGRRGA